MRKLFSVILAVAMPFAHPSASAFDFEADGIYYNITSSSEPLTVEVTHKAPGQAPYIGQMDIPNSVAYGGKLYQVTGIGNGAFQQCEGLTCLTIPESVTSLGASVFQNCTSLCSIDLPESVASIGECAFQQCTHLTSLMLPAGVTSLGRCAFSGCAGLVAIYCPVVLPPRCEADVFKEVDVAHCTLYVPMESLRVYASAFGWKGFPNMVALERVTSADGSVRAVEQEAPVYDLNGRWQGASAKKGLLIQNGQKKLIR